jgi:hypothetical protein
MRVQPPLPPLACAPTLQRDLLHARTYTQPAEASADTFAELKRMRRCYCRAAFQASVTVWMFAACNASTT